MLNIRTIIVMSIFFASAGCGNGSSQDASSGGPAGASLVDEAPILEGKLLDAVDLAISQSLMNGSLNPITLSDELIERLSQYDGVVQFESEIKNVMTTFRGGVFMEFSSNPSSTELNESSNPSVFTYQFSGEVNASVRFVDGKIGIVDGNIYVEEGTRAVLDGVDYKFANQGWIQSR